MEQFSYSFAVSMLHSLWQMAALLLLYSLLQALLPKSHPMVKRNMMYGLLVIQLLTTTITFLFYYSDPFNGIRSQFAALLTGALKEQSFLHANSTYIFYFYLAAVLYKAASLFYHWLRFRHSYRQQLQRPPVEMKLFTQLKSFQFGIKRKVTLWYSDRISTPMTFGFLKPVVLMPLALVNRLSIEETEALIIHELTHIKNSDYLLNWLLLATETMYFFNPFVRIIARRIKLEREKTCDSQVLQFNYSQVSYAEALLKTAMQKSQYNKLQMAAVKKHSHLVERIQFFTDRNNHSFRKRPCNGFSVMMMFIILVLNLYIMSQVRYAGESNPMVPDFTLLTPTLKFQQEEGLEKKFSDVAAKMETVLPVITAAATQVLDEYQEATYAPDEKTTASPNIYALNASLKEEVAPTKELIITEENSAGQKVTTAYKVQLKDGQWTREPLWMITEIKPMLDSLQLQLDSVQVALDSIQ